MQYLIAGFAGVERLALSSSLGLATVFEGGGVRDVLDSKGTVRDIHAGNVSVLFAVERGPQLEKDYVSLTSPFPK